MVESKVRSKQVPEAVKQMSDVKDQQHLQTHAIRSR